MRLIVPVNISIPFGITHSIRTVSETEITEITKRTNFNSSNFILNSRENTSLSQSSNKTNHAENGLLPIVSALWFSMVIFLIFGTVLWNIHVYRTIKKLHHVERPDIIEYFLSKCRELNLKNKIDILSMDEKMLVGPTVVGLFNPKILLPHKIIKQWTLEDIEPLIVHELVHIKQRDLYINWIQIIVQIIFFFNPFVWYANWKIRDIREQVCDDIAIKYTDNKRKTYSMSILNVIGIIFSEPMWGYADIGFSERKSSLAKRIIRISNEKYTFHKPMNLFSNVLLVITAVISLTLACDYSPEKIMGNENISVLKEVQDISQEVSSDASKDYIKIFISENGEYQIEDIRTDIQNLEDTLKFFIKNNPTKKVLLVPSPQTPDKYISYAVKISYSLKFESIYVKNLSDWR